MEHADDERESLALSIVAPLFDEATIVAALLERCLDAGERTGLRFELILVDDASTDGTGALLDACADARVRAIHLPENRGQFRATAAGLSAAQGERVAVLDGDLQDPPEDLPRLIAALDASDVDVVFAVKARRDDPAWLTLSARVYHGLQRALGAGTVPRGAGSFCVMRRALAAKVATVPVERANLAAVLGALGARSGSVPYEKRARYDGRSRVGVLGLVREAVDSMLLSGALHRLLGLLALALGLLALALAAHPLLAASALALAGVFALLALAARHVHRRGLQRTR